MMSDASLAAMLEGLDSSNAKAKTAAAFGFARMKRPYSPAVPNLPAPLKSGDNELPRPAGWDLANKDWKLPSDSDVERLKSKVAAALLTYKSPDKKTYHTIETLSKRMIFVIDVPSSMGDKIPVPDTATKEQLDAFGSRVKMDIAKNELIALLASLPDDVEFNIVTFAGSAKAWQGGLVGSGSKAAAVKFVSKLQAMQAVAGSSGRSRAAQTGSDEQKTNTYAAILAAFGYADEGTPDWKKRGKVDTIFFVTDGLPT